MRGLSLAKKKQMPGRAFFNMNALIMFCFQRAPQTWSSRSGIPPAEPPEKKRCRYDIQRGAYYSVQDYLLPVVVEKVWPIFSEIGRPELFGAGFLIGDLTSSFGSYRVTRQSSAQHGKWW
jgi:hypothetical protein